MKIDLSQLTNEQNAMLLEAKGAELPVLLNVLVPNERDRNAIEMYFTEYAQLLLQCCLQQVLDAYKTEL